MSEQVDLKDLDALSNKELRQLLVNKGVECGPVTYNSRDLYLRKLRKVVIASSDLINSETGKNDADALKGIENLECTNVDYIPRCSPSDQGDDQGEQESSSISPIFYACDIATDVCGAERASCIVSSMRELTQLLKKHPGSRFKKFTEQSAAAEYCQDLQKEPARIIQTTLQAGSDPIAKLPNLEASDLQHFRAAIQAGKVDEVVMLSWRNPNYLITSIDTPTILQPRFHYNALHACATSNQPTLCQIIISILEDESFYSIMFPFENESMRRDRGRRMLNLYLNSPEQGCGESPLHIACKFGFVELVRVLVQQPEIDLLCVNKDSKLPQEINCSRIRKSDQSRRTEAEISLLLDGVCIPVLRTSNNELPAKIGVPMSPKLLKSMQSHEPEYQVAAVAGPMTMNQAQLMMERMRGSPRAGGKGTQVRDIVCRDMEKGLERVARQEARHLNVQWTEYWNFLDNFANLNSSSDLRRFENYLSEQECSHDEVDSLVGLLQSLAVNSPQKSPRKQTEESSISSTDFRDSMEVLSDSDDSLESFQTAATSPPSPILPDVFIAGEKVSRLDVQAFYAIDHKVDAGEFPRVAHFQKRMQQFTEQQMKHFRLPHEPRFSVSTPILVKPPQRSKRDMPRLKLNF